METEIKSKLIDYGFWLIILTVGIIFFNNNIAQNCNEENLNISLLTNDLIISNVNNQLLEQEIISLEKDYQLKDKECEIKLEKLYSTYLQKGILKESDLPQEEKEIQHLQG